MQQHRQYTIIRLLEMHFTTSGIFEQAFEQHVCAFQLLFFIFFYFFFCCFCFFFLSFFSFAKARKTKKKKNKKKKKKKKKTVKNKQIFVLKILDYHVKRA